jgi:hypothetical protein
MILKWDDDFVNEKLLSEKQYFDYKKTADENLNFEISSISFGRKNFLNDNLKKRGKDKCGLSEELEIDDSKLSSNCDGNSGCAGKICSCTSVFGKNGEMNNDRISKKETIDAIGLNENNFKIKSDLSMNSHPIKDNVLTSPSTNSYISRTNWKK